MSAAVHWVAGDLARRPEIERAIARFERDEGVDWLRRRDRRRRLARVPLGDGSCFVKHYLPNDRHLWRDAWKERLGLATASREWRTLTRLRAAGIRAPAPLAHVRLASGEHALVLEWIAGVPLADALAARGDRPRVIAAVGALVHALHAAGFAHRDLHRENILIADGAAVLLDLQAARRTRSARARLADLGRLDHSLRRVLSRGDRVRLRAAALGAALPLADADRARVRAVGAASLARAREHAQSRAQRSLREGRRAQHFAHDGGHGLVSRACEPDAVHALLAGAHADGREVRRYAAHLSDLWRGSAARRAWAVAHALEANELATVTPLAFVEWSRAGLPRGSVLVVARAADAPAPLATRIDAEVDLLGRLHEAGFATDGLDARGLALVARAGGVAASALAIEALRFPAHPTRAERLAALARLDAEWQRLGAPEALRKRAAARYRRRVGR